MSLGLDEEKAKAMDAERAVDANYGKLRIVWLAILATLVVLFVVTRLVEPAAYESGTLFWILLALGVADLGASFVLKQKMLRTAVEQRKPQLVPAAYIVALALCESAGIFGLVAHFVTGVKYYYFLFVVAGFGMMLHKPQRDDVLAAAHGAGHLWQAKKQD
jgi:F0F1-type ATP synthase membrane subunit c/vacuolar-type H+-ATPase subunit K